MLSFPLKISIYDALRFHNQQRGKPQNLLVMARYWRTNVMDAEEDWYEELTADELEDENFLQEFADAEFQLWLR